MNAAVKVRPQAAKQFRDGWMSFLRVLARDSKIKFAVGNPATDGKTIYLPALPAALTDDDLVLFKRFGYHEVGHVQHSDLEFYKNFGKEHGKQAHFLLNAIEDVWMEETQCRHSRPAARYFREGIAIMTRKRIFRDGSKSPFEAIACYCRTSLGARKWTEFAESASVNRESVRTHFGEHADQLLENLDEILFREFPNVRSTKDAGALALRIIAMLKEQSQQQEEKPEQPDEEEEQGDDSEQADGEQEEEQGDESDSGQTDSDESDDSQQDGSCDAGDDEGEDEDQEGKGTGDSGDSDSDADDQGEDQDADAGNGDSSEESSGTEAADGESKGDGQPSLEQIINQMFEDDIEEGEVFDDRKYIESLAEQIENGEATEYEGQQAVPAFEVDGEPVSQQSTGAGKQEALIEGMPVCPADLMKGKEIEGRLDRKFQVLAMKLQSLLMNREEAEVYTTTRGRLGDAHLYRFGLGNTRIFEQQEEAERVTAAVSLVADLSGSTLYVPELVNMPAPRTNEEAVAREEMRIQKCAFTHIQQSLLVMEKMLDQLGNPREIIGFAPKTGQLSTIVRTFGDDHQTAKTRIGGLSQVVGGGHTPIGEAVFQATIRLMGHEAQRKVMFVLTDGVPNDQELAKYQTEAAIAAGITVVYLLIGEAVESDWLTEMGCPFVHAKTADELCPLLLETAESLLM